MKKNLKLLKNLNRTSGSREEYNLILPVVLNIATIASNHGTNQFMNYLAEMKKVEEMMRAGADIQCMNHLQRTVPTNETLFVGTVPINSVSFVGTSPTFKK